MNKSPEKSRLLNNITLKTPDRTRPPANRLCAEKTYRTAGLLPLDSTGFALYKSQSLR